VLLRVRGRTAPWWLTAAYVAAVVPADYVIATSMLRGIRRRTYHNGAHAAHLTICHCHRTVPTTTFPPRRRWLGQPV